jgi:hypothetical protein
MNEKLVNTVRPFVCHNGAHLNSVKDLALALEDMDENVYRYHVTENKNDFATWISETVVEKNLAEKIGKIKNRNEMKYQIMKYILVSL